MAQPSANAQRIQETRGPVLCDMGLWMSRANWMFAQLVEQFQHLLRYMHVLRVAEPVSAELPSAGCGGCALGKSNFLVLVDGNIGSGKSDLVKKLEVQHGENDNVIFYHEQVGSWEKHLAMLYDALASPQPGIIASLQRTMAQGEAAIFESRAQVKRDAQRPVIVDGSVRSCVEVFAPELVDRGLLPAGAEPGGLQWMQDQYQKHISDAANRPDLVIYLKRDIKEAASRIQKRAEEGRPELGMPQDYLEALQRRFDAMYPEEGLGSEGVIRVDTSGKSPEEIASQVENVLAAELSKSGRLSGVADDSKRGEAAMPSGGVQIPEAAAAGGA